MNKEKLWVLEKETFVYLEKSFQNSLWAVFKMGWGSWR